MLAALPEHHDLFRKISHNPFLMSDGIGFDPKSITAERLREEAWRTGEHLLKVGPGPASTAETAMKQNHNGKEPGT